jgi:hypothetical protein
MKNIKIKINIVDSPNIVEGGMLSENNDIILLTLKGKHKETYELSEKLTKWLINNIKE